MASIEGSEREASPVNMEDQEFEDIIDDPVDDDIDYDSDLDAIDADAEQDYNADDDINNQDDALASTVSSFGDASSERVATPDLTKFSHGDRVKMIHMRRFLDQIAELVNLKNYVVQKTREELKECQVRVEELRSENSSVRAEIEKENELGNRAAVDRLLSQLERTNTEIAAERELEIKIQIALDSAEYELNQVQVKQSKYLLADAELQIEENKLLKERSEVARLRQKKETKQLARQERFREPSDQSLSSKEQSQQKILEAKRHRDKTTKFLQQSIQKSRAQAEELDARRSEYFDRRVNTVVSLKQSISANKENLRATQARDQSIANAAQRVEEGKRDEITKLGGNPDQAMLIQKRRDEFQKERELFELKQEALQVEIAAKILEEERRMQKRVRQLPDLFPPEKKAQKKKMPEKKTKTLKILEQAGLDYSADLEIPLTTKDDEFSSDDEKPADSSSFSMTKIDSDGEDNVAEPEFEGMWNQQHKRSSAQSTVQATQPNRTKMEQEILDKVLTQHRSGITRPQVVSGKEFKGISFYSKPDVIHFKDFDVGKTYRKKVTLTNVSYTVNHCRLMGITESLKDFIDIRFDPPGQMSAGLTCEMLVTFKPMINEDLEGTVDFLAQTGPFAIPLICTTKKCDLSLDHTRINFGTSVIGETVKRYFTLTNNGALATNFELFKVSNLKAKSEIKDDSSIGGLEQDDVSARIASETVDDSKSKSSAQKREEGSSQTPVADDNVTKTDEEGEVIEKVEGEREDSPVAESTMEDQELEDLDGFSCGQIKSGEIGPFSSVKLEIVWQPTVPGHTASDFVVLFDDPDSERLGLTTVAEAIDVPVWVERNDIDLKICMYDRLYQDTILVKNRAKTALRLTFEVCKELKNHVELLPKTGYIQAQSTFSAQLKFLPRKSLAEEGGDFFDADTGVLQAPMQILVADQTRPVPFTMHAIVTCSELSFDYDKLDFGHATIHETVRRSVKLTNHSILPQQFGFVNLPQYVDVQPNDGFGTLLPLETVDIDINFSPPKAGNYNFQLTCKSLINKEFKISCKAVGVHPPLKLSDHVVRFKATSVNDVATTDIHVINDHISTNQFTHPVPRIGEGEICPVGPTSFEFVVPRDAPITLSPCVGTVQPNGKTRIHIRYTPTLESKSVKMEAVEMIKRSIEKRREEAERQRLEREAALAEEEKKAETAKSKGGKGAKGKDAKGGKESKAGSKSPKKEVESTAAVQLSIYGGEDTVPEWESIENTSDEYAQAQAQLLRNFQAQLESFVIPCYIASGKCSKPGALKYSVHNTINLLVHCPVIRPELTVISDNGRNVTDFGEVSRGQSVSKSITIQNITRETLVLRGSILDTGGPFLVLNSFRPLEADATHTILVSFTPDNSRKYHEVLEIDTGKTVLHLTLKGQGVYPRVRLNVDDILDMGAVITGEYVERTFEISNTSPLAIDYELKVDSMSLLRFAHAQELPAFVSPETHKKKRYVGTQNNSGKVVFDFVPAQGRVHPGDVREITVTFAPDHDSDFYSDAVRLELFGQEESYSFNIIGQAKPHIMYMCGGDELTSGVESLTVLPTIEEEGKPPPTILLLNLFSTCIDGENFTTAKRDVFAGCVRTMAVSQKKNGEFSCENPAAIMAKGFNVDPQKGQVEAGTKKPVTFTWTPVPKQDPNVVVESQIGFTVKGDTTDNYLVMLRGHIVTELAGTGTGDLKVEDLEMPAPQLTPVPIQASRQTPGPHAGGVGGAQPVMPVVVPP